METSVKIDREFRAMCPPISDSERELLKQSIAADGCRDSLVAWNGLILDGHNRYELCKELGKTFRVEQVTLVSRDEAKRWILRNQLARRNLNVIQASYIRGRYFNTLKMPRGLPSGRKMLTRQVVAKELGVGEQTVVSDGHLAAAVDGMCDAAKAMVLSHGFWAKKQHLIDLGAMSHDSQRLIVAKIESGEIDCLQDAILKLRPPATFGANGAHVDFRKSCPKCKTRILRNSGVCLKCDLTDSDIKRRLTKQQPVQSEGEPPSDWRDRLTAMRRNGAAGNEVLYHVNGIRDWMQFHDPDDNDEEYELLSALAADIGKKMRRSRDFTLGVKG